MGSSGTWYTRVGCSAVVTGNPTMSNWTIQTDGHVVAVLGPSLSGIASLTSFSITIIIDRTGQLSVRRRVEVEWKKSNMSIQIEEGIRTRK